MSGRDEMPSFQCPLCDRNRSPTEFWSAYIGKGARGNWCHLNIDRDTGKVWLWRKNLQYRSQLLRIDSVRCRARTQMGQLLERHVFLPNSPTFERVKAAILREDKMMRQEEFLE